MRDGAAKAWLPSKSRNRTLRLRTTFGRSFDGESVDQLD